MGQLKNYFIEYLTAEDFDYMTDDEFDYWLETKTAEEKKLQDEQYEEEKSAYEEALGWGK